MSKYAGLAATARSLLAKKGTDILLSRDTAGGYDPVTQATTSPGTTTATFKGVALPPGRSAEFRVGSLVDRRIMQFYLAQKDVALTPQNGDRLTLNGSDWKVIWTQTYDPAADGAVLTECYGER